MTVLTRKYQGRGVSLPVQIHHPGAMSVQLCGSRNRRYSALICFHIYIPEPCVGAGIFDTRIVVIHRWCCPRDAGSRRLSFDTVNVRKNEKIYRAIDQAVKHCR